MSRGPGYILVETLTAMAVLSVVAVTVQQAVRTAVQARGLSHDYTIAQWLMEEIDSRVSLEPLVAAGEVHTGMSAPPNDRFEYTWEVERIEVPLPAAATLTEDERASLASRHLGYMGRLKIEIRWYRGGVPFSVTGERLLGPDQIWIAPSERAP